MDNDTLLIIRTIKSDLDSRAKEIIDQLLEKMAPDGRIDLVLHDKSKPHVLESAAKDMSRHQFHTQREKEIFCRGTTGLLELLENYHYERTLSAVVAAIPHSRVCGGSGGNFSSYIEEEHLEKYYTDTRQVSVVVLVPIGMINFCFEEKVQK